jgi:biotin transport system substrate-specific component
MVSAALQPRVLADVGTQTWVRNLILVVGGAAFVGLSAQIAIPLPFTPVPLTLQTFAVLVTGAALGSLRGVLSLTIYAVAGVLGIPWFAEGSSGFSSPSFGYIIGFILAALIVGRIAEHGATQSVARSAGLMLVGNLVIYAVGVCWLKFAIDADWATAIALGLTPFVVGDAIKIAAAAGLLPIAWSCLRKVGLVT